MNEDEMPADRAALLQEVKGRPVGTVRKLEVLERKEHDAFIIVILKAMKERNETTTSISDGVPWAMRMLSRVFHGHRSLPLYLLFELADKLDLELVLQPKAEKRLREKGDE